MDEDMQELALSYINGNISYVRDKLKHDSSLKLALADELFNTLSTQDYRLFLKRMQ